MQVRGRVECGRPWLFETPTHPEYNVGNGEIGPGRVHAGQWQGHAARGPAQQPADPAAHARPVDGGQAEYRDAGLRRSPQHTLGGQLAARVSADRRGRRIDLDVRLDAPDRAAAEVNKTLQGIHLGGIAQAARHFNIVGRIAPARGHARCIDHRRSAPQGADHRRPVATVRHDVDHRTGAAPDRDDLIPGAPQPGHNGAADETARAGDGHPANQR